MRSLNSAFALASIVLATAVAPVAAQSLHSQLSSLREGWEESLDAGDGQKVRQAAEDLLKSYEPQISPSNYNDQHAKVGLLGFAARGAVLDGDWPGAVSLLTQASATAQANLAATSQNLGNLRKQHETKISEWKQAMLPAEERLKWLKDQPGLRSEEIKEYTDLETFLAEHQSVISSSEQSIADIDDILSQLKAEDVASTRSLAEWSAFLQRERTEVQELGSPQRYVAEKLAQITTQGGRTRFERISYARRLLRLDADNEQCKAYLSIQLVSSVATQ
jgi:competence protein ComGF